MSELETSPYDPGSQPGLQSLRFLSNPEQMLVFMLDAAGMCEFVSPSWIVLTGRTCAQELGNGWLARVHPQDRQSFESGLASAMRSAQPVRQLFRLQGGDGAYRWFVSQGMPRLDTNGRLLGYLGLCLDVTSQQVGDTESDAAAQHMMNLLRHTRLIAVVLDTRGHVQFSNGSLCRLLQYSGVELMDCPLFERLAAPGSRALVAGFFPEPGQHMHVPSRFETDLLSRAGTSRTVAWHAIVVRDHHGNARHTILIGDDITELRKTEAQVTVTAKIFEATHHAMLVTTLDGTIVAINAAYTNLTGYTSEESLGQNPRMLQSGRHDANFYAQLWKRLLATGHWHGDVWDRRKDGSIYPKYLSISVVRDATGEATHYSGIFYDISERKTVEERLDRLAHYDALTGLPNRSLLMDRLEQSAERARRQNLNVGLLYLDLDHFKWVNDTLGHAAGDSLLREVARRVKGCVRAADTAARLGGDEFVVLVPDSASAMELETVARKINLALAQPFEIDGCSVCAQASVGISVFPQDGADVQELLKHADAAMYQVKQNGRGSYCFYNRSAK